jgi:hypothetical protein
MDTWVFPNSKLDYNVVLPTLPSRVKRFPESDKYTPLLLRWSHLSHTLVAAVTFRFIVLCVLAANEFDIPFFKWLSWTIRETSFSACKNQNVVLQLINFLHQQFGGSIRWINSRCNVSHNILNKGGY